MPLHTPREPELDWRPIDGAYEAELALGPPPGSRADCNTYLLRTPEYALAIDPGADEDRAADLAVALRRMAREMPRQIVLLLTHCHADHCQAANGILATEGLTASLACHKQAADLLRAGDGEQAGDGAPGTPGSGAQHILGLFALAGGGTARDLATPGGGLRSLSIPISARDALRVYHAPGHSPDSLCFRVGCALFVGDIPCARRPEAPAPPESDRRELAATLEKLLWLMDHANVTTVYPGHGPALPRAEARDRFKALLADLG